MSRTGYLLRDVRPGASFNYCNPDITLEEAQAMCQERESTPLRWEADDNGWATVRYNGWDGPEDSPDSSIVYRIS